MTSSTNELNQCDGCRVKAPYFQVLPNKHRDNWLPLHRMPDGGAMGCTKHLYVVPD